VQLAVDPHRRRCHRARVYAPASRPAAHTRRCGHRLVRRGLARGHV